MALIKCPECRGQVSDQAVACPHCGHPTAALATKKRAVLGVAMGLVMAGVMAALVFNQKATGGGSTMPMVISIAVAILVLAVLAAVTLRRRPI